MIQVLESTQTAGDSFQVRGGDYLIALVDYTAATKVQFLDWTASDPSADASWKDTEIIFDSDGVKEIILVAGQQYRVVATTAGAEARLYSSRTLDLPNLE